MNEVLKRVKDESDGDTRQYLINCKQNYTEYLEAAKILFPYYYDNLEQIIEIDKDCEIAEQHRNAGDVDFELKVLVSMIEKGSSLPGVYIRAASIFKRNNENNKAKEIILKWFESEFWKVPNMASGSLKLLDILEKLK